MPQVGPKSGVSAVRQEGCSDLWKQPITRSWRRRRSAVSGWENDTTPRPRQEGLADDGAQCGSPGQPCRGSSCATSTSVADLPDHVQRWISGSGVNLNSLAHRCMVDRDRQRRFSGLGENSNGELNVEWAARRSQRLSAGFGKESHCYCRVAAACWRGSSSALAYGARRSGTLLVRSASRAIHQIVKRQNSFGRNRCGLTPSERWLGRLSGSRIAVSVFGVRLVPLGSVHWLPTGDGARL